MRRLGISVYGLIFIAFLITVIGVSYWGKPLGYVVPRFLSDVVAFAVLAAVFVVVLRCLEGRVRYARTVAAIVSYAAFIAYATVAKYLILPSLGIGCTEFINVVVKTAPYAVPIITALILLSSKSGTRH